jgi:hypothetical protein
VPGLTKAFLLLVVIATSGCTTGPTQVCARLSGGELWSEGVFQIGVRFEHSPIMITEMDVKADHLRDLLRVKVRNDSQQPLRWSSSPSLWKAELFTESGDTPKTVKLRYPTQVLDPSIPPFQGLAPHQQSDVNISLIQAFQKYELPRGRYFLLLTYDPIQIWNAGRLVNGRVEFIYHGEGIFTNKTKSAPLPILLR